MRAFLVPLGVTYDAPLRASWDIIHPTTNERVGAMDVADLVDAPVGTYDLGDPFDDVSLRQTKLSNAAANAIAAEFNLSTTVIRNRTGAQILKFLCAKLFEAQPTRTPTMSVVWDGVVVDPVRTTD